MYWDQTRRPWSTWIWYLHYMMRLLHRVTILTWYHMRSDSLDLYSEYRPAGKDISWTAEIMAVSLAVPLLCDIATPKPQQWIVEPDISICEIWYSGPTACPGLYWLHSSLLNLMLGGWCKRAEATPAATHMYEHVHYVALIHFCFLCVYMHVSIVFFQWPTLGIQENSLWSCAGCRPDHS